MLMKKILKYTIYIITIMPILLLAQNKLLLSKAIQSELDARGIESAKKYFARAICGGQTRQIKEKQ